MFRVLLIFRNNLYFLKIFLNKKSENNNSKIMHLLSNNLRNLSLTFSKAQVRSCKVSLVNSLKCPVSNQMYQWVNLVNLCLQ